MWVNKSFGSFIHEKLKLRLSSPDILYDDSRICLQQAIITRKIIHLEAIWRSERRDDRFNYIIKSTCTSRNCAGVNFMIVWSMGIFLIGTWLMLDVINTDTFVCLPRQSDWINKMPAALLERLSCERQKLYNWFCNPLRRNVISQIATTQKRFVSLTMKREEKKLPHD